MKKILIIFFAAFLFCAGFVEAAKINASLPLNYVSLTRYWTFDGGKSIDGVFRDSISGDRLYAANIATSTFYVKGRNGTQAVRFDGDDDTLSTSTDAIGVGAVTVCSWIYLYSWGEGSLGRIIDNGQFQFYVNNVNGNTQGLRFTSEGATTVDSAASSLTLNAWYFVCVTRASGSTGTANFYINGALSGIANQMSGSPKSGSPTYVGNTSGGTRTFDGIIDDLRVYNRALTSAEMASLYKAGQGGTVSAPPADSLTTGLATHWSFDSSTSTGRMLDLSTTSNHAYFTNISTSTFYVQGKIGQAGNFDGIDDHVGTSTNALNVPVTTMAAWIKIPALPSASSTIMGMGDSPTNSSVFDKILYIRTDGKLQWYIYDGAVKYTSVPGATLPINTWVHVMAVADGTNCKTYVNNIEVGTTACGNTHSTYSAGNFRVGSPVRNTASLSLSYFTGQIDDVRVYNRALGADERSALYNLGVSRLSSTPKDFITSGTTGTSSLIAHWTFDGKDMINGVLRDVSGNGYHMNLVNVSTSTFYAPGRIGQAGDFDGSDDYALVANVNGGAGVASATFTAWVRPEDTLSAYDSILETRTTTLRGLLISGAVGHTGAITHAWDNASDEWDGTTGLGLNTNEWYFIAAVIEPTQAIIYRGDSRGNLSTYTNSNTNTQGSLDASTWYIGRDPTTPGREWPGKIDDVRIYSRALSANEIRTLYNMGL